MSARAQKGWGFADDFLSGVTRGLSKRLVNSQHHPFGVGQQFAGVGLECRGSNDLAFFSQFDLRNIGDSEAQNLFALLAGVGACSKVGTEDVCIGVVHP